ncbi:MAG: DNA replication and repair protein RecF, partial [Bacteroidales bacterium]|nr:DNA replication and repair protein RecF [Bacteroidales bacterium]
MYLKRIIISGFKNISEAEIEFSSKLNCITGMNGSGKTNLLDAIYYLSMTKSYFSNTDLHTIAYDSELCRVSGEYTRDDDSFENISVSMEREGLKHIKRNNKNYSRLSEHIGLIPIVMVSPYDTCLINESGEERRRFINSILSQLDKEYLRKVQNYNHLLQQRNRLLKSQYVNEELLETFSQRMSVNASYIFGKRAEFTHLLMPIADKYYKMLSGGKESISIVYKSDLQDGELVDLLKSSQTRDQALKYTT